MSFVVYKEILYNKLKIYLGLILFSLIGCQATLPSSGSVTTQKTESSKGISNFLGDIFGYSPYNDSVNNCWRLRTREQVFILAMGANTGIQGRNRLEETAHDAEKFAQAMQGLFRVSNVCLLRDVSKLEFRQAFYRLSNIVNPSDLVIIYFSGHGYKAHDDQNKDEIDGWDEFFVTYSKSEINYFGIDEFMIRDDEFSRLIAALNTNNILTVADVCFSEGFDKGKGSTERIKSLRGGTRNRKIPSHIGATLDPIKGILLSATTENQNAVELHGRCDKIGVPEDIFGGRFTHFFLQALKQAKRQSIKVNLLQVFNEAQYEVIQHSKRCSEKLQTPVRKGSDRLFQRMNRYIP